MKILSSGELSLRRHQIQAIKIPSISVKTTISFTAKMQCSEESHENLLLDLYDRDVYKQWFLTLSEAILSRD